MNYDLQVLKDKKLKSQLAAREELYGKSAKAAAKAEKVSYWGMVVTLVNWKIGFIHCDL